ncbi:MAG: hypothetical protein ACD_18C00063G0001 [uncultured bacterium]|nr:MAG: hypothetical protein ACD_18C00063G0001 [uncultured bacterium]OGH84409.1 MAG: hypothetical protein A2488_03335 [Candidatus Magasanikbacteria bacterium RIFOXYC12_FULL_32_21b]OGH91644.1 MAG: hypothetical protein A2507_04115 [Candidatus Magasanikbacteria bacterium RIFOXYD12_FULL_33_17]HAO52258.1 hypothetical protein [Candidatus Magasanikbacteria bacterium]
MSEEQNMSPKMEEKSTEMTPSQEESNISTIKKQSPLMMILGGFVVALILGFGIFYGVTLSQVKNLSRSNFTLKSAALLNLSIASINGKKVLYSEYVDNIQAMEKFYQTDDSGQQVPTDAERSDFVLSRLLVNNLIAQVAKDMDVSVTKADIDKIAEEQIVTGFPSREDAEKEIMNRYGWTLEHFLQEIVYSTELEKKVAAKYAEQHPVDTNADASVEAQAIEILQQIKDGADFAEMATQFGSDGTKDQGGDLGWFSRGQMVAEFEDAAFSLNKGELNPELVKTQFGYHVLQVTDKRTTKDDAGNEVEEVQARHILFPFQESNDDAFRLFMNEQLKNSKIDIIANVHNPFEGLFDEEAELPVTTTDEVVQ